MAAEPPPTLPGVPGPDTLSPLHSEAKTPTVTLDSPAGTAEIARLTSHVDAHCPVLDLLANATPVELELSARPATDEAAA